MITTEKLERKFDAARAAAEHVEALVKALGDPSAWKFTHKVIDAGPEALRSIDPPRCACGHPIRFIYLIELTRDLPGHRAGEQTQVGSVCISHVAALAPELAAEIAAAAERVERELADARRAAAEAARNEEATRLRAEFEAVWNQAHDLYHSYKSRGQMAPYGLWEVVVHSRRRVPDAAPEYQRTSDLIRWYRRAIERLRAVMEAQ
jgi:hypothetical protein